MTGTNATAGIWATYPQPYLSIGGGVVDQVVGTMLLMLGVMAIGDADNMAPATPGRPALVGILVVGVGACFGLNAGEKPPPPRPPLLCPAARDPHKSPRMDPESTGL